MFWKGEDNTFLLGLLRTRTQTTMKTEKKVMLEALANTNYIKRC